MIEVREFLENYAYIDEDITLEIIPQDNKKTIIDYINIDGGKVKKYINEFWTSRQRQASSIHEISYRACFKPQLPRFFINLLSKVGDTVYDPFTGRGTTPIEAGLMGRKTILNDINPLSIILTVPRLLIPSSAEVKERLDEIGFKNEAKADIDLSMFYHPKTEVELVSLKSYLYDRKESGREDLIDRWIRMVATNRLTGHSPGFFSVYTLPPNQAVSQESQIRINQKRNQKPSYKDIKTIILKKTKSLQRNITSKQISNLRKAYQHGLFLNKDSRKTTDIKDESVQLTVTSPPFLNIVQYSKDNWLRCWFNSIDDKTVSKRITMATTIDKWVSVMDDVFKELYRITKKGGWVAFEVGEVKKGRVNLDEYVVPLGSKAGFECEGILINLQQFTKTSNIWGVSNNQIGTNTNRVVIFKKN
jgi:DNA modification methylase